MGEEFRSVVALIVGAIVLVVCYIKLFLKGRSFNQRFVERAKAQGSFTTATLIDHKCRLGNDESGSSYFQNDRMKCTYEYKVNGTSYKKKMTFQSPFSFQVSRCFSEIREHESYFLLSVFLHLL